MKKRWLAYLAVLLISLTLYGAVDCWLSWIGVLTAAAAPLVSVALSAILGEADALGLFPLPARCGEMPDYALRAYRPGDAPGRVHWKRKAKTGEWLVREERLLPVPHRRRIPAILPVAISFALLFCLFPPGEYGQRLQSLFRQETQVRLDLYIGPRQEDRQAVLDVVAAKAQTVYLRGQTYETYDGKSWRAAKRNSWTVWEPVGQVDVAARPPREMQFVSCDVAEQPSSRYLQLPQSTKAWAKPLAEGKTVAQIGELVRKLGEYDENARMMPENGDFVRCFAESGRGYCIHFASAAVVLLRCAGIPARLATGYTVQVQAGLRRTVTGSDAHAWAEYWDGQRWRILEATPTVEASVLPPVQEESRQSGGWWALILLPLPACFKKRKEPLRLKMLRQKAAFSQYGLTPEETAELKRLRKLPRYRYPFWPFKGRVKAVHTFLSVRKARRERKGRKVKQDEKKPISWEVADPKPPVIQSGKMENRKQN